MTIFTEDRVATLHALLNDSAVKIGEQRLVIKELREALKPFASQRAKWSDRLPDTQGFGVMCISSPGDGPFHFDADITMGDFRKAEAVLAALKATGEA